MNFTYALPLRADRVVASQLEATSETRDARHFEAHASAWAFARPDVTSC